MAEHRARPTFARTVLQPRWLALLVLVIVVAYGFALMGMWQLNVAQDRGREEAQAQALARPVVPLESIVKPHQAMTEEAAARMVTVQGRYDAARQVFITDRRLGERTGYWVLTPLVTDKGAVLPVLRGFVTEPGAANRPPATEVSLTGMYAPNEGPPDQRRSLPADQLQKVDLGDLVNRWPEDLYNGFLFATAETPAVSWGAGSALTLVPPPSAAPTELNWRNLSYAAQWWVFAAFGVYMYWRMVREDLRRRRLEYDHQHAPDPAVEHAPENAPAAPVAATRRTPAGG
ncbi:MAG: SURF1 family protein [Austwickia sp.]|nr:SURF1 family protein [Austwickia sp.]MBK8436687.1 SURF1 family protein [Austwickia sp.]MBK9100318.1 SURF1 family protein [Austwickia sp.]